MLLIKNKQCQQPDIRSMPICCINGFASPDQMTPALKRTVNQIKDWIGRLSNEFRKNTLLLFTGNLPFQITSNVYTTNITNKKIRN